jgi:four helix bundle protein
MAGFEDLEVWKKAVDMSADVYRSLAGCADFGFRDQITRASLSIPSNIAEGMERSSPADRSKFLDYARGSCGEFRTQAVVGVRAGLLEAAAAEKWIHTSREISAMIQGLIRSIKSPGL